MTYVPIAIENFGGLHTRNDPTEVGLGVATALANVDIDAVGTLRTRDGFALEGNTTGVSFPLCYYESAAGNKYVLGTTTGLTTTPLGLGGTANGAAVATVAGTSNGMVRFATGTKKRLYLVDGTATMRRLEGTAWTSVSLPSVAVPKFAAIYPTDNRLAVAGDQRVWFSAIDDPETWSYGAGPPETGDFVDLDPGDGESITAMATWRDQLIVFKRTKFFVFYGTSVDNDGGPIFQYRAVRNTAGTFADGNATAGSDGVYFIDWNGVYVTNGDVPVSVTDALDWTSTNFTSPVSFFYANRHLYSLDTTTRVYDTRQDQWIEWGNFDGGGCGIPAHVGPYQTSQAVIVDQASFRLAYLPSGVPKTTDNGTAITWSYTTGISDLGVPDRKVLRELSLWGKGTVTVQVSVDGAAFDTGSAITLGTSAIAEGVQRIARRGTNFQLKFSGTGVASINRAVLRLRDQEAPK